MRQTISTGASPRVVLGYIAGDLHIEGWGDSSIRFETDDEQPDVVHDADQLRIERCDDDLSLRVPIGSEVQIEHIESSATLRRVRRVTIGRVEGDLELAEIAERIELQDVDGDLEVERSGELQVNGSLGGDVSVKEVGVIELRDSGGDVELINLQTARLGSIGGDLEVHEAVELLQFSDIGGSFSLRGRGRTSVTGGSVGADAEISEVASVEIANIGADLDLRAASGNVTIGNLGGDAQPREIAGDLRLGNVGGSCDLRIVRGALALGAVGGDAELREVASIRQIGSIGGDLQMYRAALDLREVGSTGLSITVGGDARIELQPDTAVTINATVGGDLRAQQVNLDGPGIVTLVYAGGGPEVRLMVGGDLQIIGGGVPSMSGNFSGKFSGFGESMRGFGDEMGRLGEELGRMGEEIAREVERELRDLHGPDLDERMRRVQERVERARERIQERARRVEERAASGAEGRGPRVNLKFNEREWRVDPERIERIKEQARRAAAEGLAGALEGVERALARLRSSGASTPTPPVPPVPPRPPAAPTPAVPSSPARAASAEPFMGETVKIPIDVAEQQRESGDAAAVAPVADREQQREAILRMIAEGRITPEEGDMLLEALG